MTSLVQLLAGLTGMLVLWGVAWLLWPRDFPAPERTRACSHRPEPAQPARTLHDEATEILGDVAPAILPAQPRRKRPPEDTLMDARPTLSFMRTVGPSARDKLGRRGPGEVW